MKINEVNSDVSVIERLTTKSHEQKIQYAKKIDELELNYSYLIKVFDNKKFNLIQEKQNIIKRKELEIKDLIISNEERIKKLDLKFSNEFKNLKTKKEKLILEKESMIKKEDFVIEAVNLSIVELKKVRIFFWYSLSFVICMFLLNLNNNGPVLNYYSLFILILMSFIFFGIRTITQHIDEIMFIYKLSQCSISPPFFFRWFNKPNLKEISHKLSSVYLSETIDKYEKLISSAEIELQRKNKELLNKQQHELAILNQELNNDLNTTQIQFKSIIEKLGNDYKEILNRLEEIHEKKHRELVAIKDSVFDIINSYFVEINAAIIRLDKVVQTCSDQNNLIGDSKNIKSKQCVFSQQFYFSHFENLLIDNKNYQYPIYFQFGCMGNIHIEKDINENNKIKCIIRDLVFRNLLGLKFSKLKLTMYDPIELGAFFSDYHKLNKEITGGFVYHTIDELNEILDGTLRHISMVVQKILTNKYLTLDEFNEQNSELAEPYKLLILNDFPKSFEDYQLGKIKQILSSGPKCGVYTILIGSIAKLGLSSINSLDVSKITPILKEQNIDFLVESINIGTISAGTITVDLNTILNQENNWWTNDSSSFIELPLGKKGKEIQSLKFDNKDDNQALMIGKPGSGKSNLLHVIILSAITKYGPSDLEIFLIDFKGGVEFMPYAEYNIPQLRTVALESDREFGLSVIDGVDKELSRRETLFRNNGVQNIEQYNQKIPNQKIPRILFIVDEFQEFFKIEDDIKEQVSLKYDNIIRKGRAFGINSLFSSQTLDGHSIPRSTKELIDIRIALMCGDNDIREIMNDKNLAAKDLSRPGEAIYNADNGKANGNQRFQAVFVERNNINEIISKVSKKSTSGYNLKDRFIFRGDIKAKINKENHPINNPENLKFKAIRLWIGEPVSMDPDYFIDVKKVSAQNIIVFGNNEDSAALFSSIIYSMKQQQNKIDKLHIINPLTDVDDGFENYNKAYGLFEKIQFTKVSELDNLLDELNIAIENRKNSNQTSKNIMFVLNSINKIPKLREDHLECLFDRLFTILNEGPELGVHCFIHCDNLLTLKRTNLNTYLSLFNHRIVFNLSQDGFYDVIGNNSIKNLKQNRLVYYTDELGKYQIIKPYEIINNL